MPTSVRDTRATAEPFAGGQARPEHASWIASAVLATAVAGVFGVYTARAEDDRERAFLDDNHVAMDAMMSGMAVNASGDVDRDFVAMMVPHYQGAVAMAKAELRYGRDERLRRIAQEIVVDQLQEIAAMRQAFGGTAASAASASSKAAGSITEAAR